ncbi:MAG: hypothetical protein MJ025_06660 [Victivallaceae bacterium]|nr:hypothetical protein [Victivallaceae bacterium]
MYREYNIKEKKCLTCEYFKIDRKINQVCNKVCIDYDAIGIGKCSMYRDTPRPRNTRAGATPWCHYKRWMQLPDD